MPDYLYRACDPRGKIISGVMAAADPEDLYNKLSGIGCYPVGIRLRKRAAFSFRKKVSRRDLITFTIHLGTVLASGVPLAVGLQDLVDQTEEGFFRKVLENLQRNIEAGTSLSKALREYPDVFPELYVAMIRAGESTGKMDEAFQSLSGHLEWLEELTGQIKQATLYPLIVFWAIVGLVALIFTVVLPRFLVIFEKSRFPLPLPTRIVIGVSRFMAEHWGGGLLGLVILILALRFLKRSPTFRIFYDRLKLGIPVFGSLNRKIILARLAHTFSDLYCSGVNVIQALQLVEKTCANDVYERAVRKVRQRVSEGRKMADSLRETGLFPPLFLRMVDIGEETGRLDFTLDKLSHFYDREIPMTVKKVFGIMEPLIIVLLGGVVGMVAMSVFFPLYQMMSGIGR